MYSFTVPSTSALDGVGGGQRHIPAALLPGKTRCPLYRKLGGPQGRSGRVRKISLPTGIRSPDRPARSESLYRLRSMDFGGGGGVQYNEFCVGFGPSFLPDALHKTKHSAVNCGRRLP